MASPDETDNDSPRPNLIIDWELYGEYLEEADLTDDQKREFIETLWSIMVSFVDLGFGIHPLQHACGQIDLIPTPDSAVMLESKDHKQQDACLNAAGHRDGTCGDKEDS